MFWQRSSLAQTVSAHTNSFAKRIHYVSRVAVLGMNDSQVYLPAATCMLQRRPDIFCFLARCLRRGCPGSM